MFCLSSDHLLDRTIFRDTDDTSGHAVKENLSQSEKCLLSQLKKLQSCENNYFREAAENQGSPAQNASATKCPQKSRTKTSRHDIFNLQFHSSKIPRSQRHQEHEIRPTLAKLTAFGGTAFGDTAFHIHAPRTQLRPLVSVFQPQPVNTLSTKPAERKAQIPNGNSQDAQPLQTPQRSSCLLWHSSLANYTMMREITALHFAAIASKTLH